MKLLIVGLGSMGKRRARLSKGIDAALHIVGVDTAEARRAEACSLGLADAAYPTIAEAVAAEHPDAALVCTAPLSHAAVIGELLDNDLPVFTELNLVGDGYAENMAKAAAGGFINATDCADYLTKKGMPFRDAYKLTGCMVSDCIQKDKVLEELSLEEFKGYSALFENDVYDAIDLIKCCEGRTSYGGPSEASVRKQIELASAQLGAWEAENA